MVYLKVISKFTFTLFFGMIYLGLSSGLPVEQNQNFQCQNSDSDLTFELIKGYHQLSTGRLSEGGVIEVNKDLNTIQLCIEACRQNPECHSLNYQQDAGCVLFKINVSLNFSLYDADDSTYYAKKICLSGADRLCAGRPWAFEVAKEMRLDDQLSIVSESSENILKIKTRLLASTGTVCMEHCLNEKDFLCRLATFSNEMKECILTNSLKVDDLVNDPSSSSILYYRTNCNGNHLERSSSSLENTEGLVDDHSDGITENIKSFNDKENLNKSSSNKNQQMGYLKWQSGNSSKNTFIYAGIVVQLIALMALFFYCYWRKRKIKRERATPQVATTELMPPPYSNANIYDDDAFFYPNDSYYFNQIQHNDGEGQQHLPTYWEAINVPSPDVEGSSFNWEVIDNKVFLEDPPPAYVEIESPLTDSSNVSNTENANAGDNLPAF